MRAFRVSGADGRPVSVASLERSNCPPQLGLVLAASDVLAVSEQADCSRSPTQRSGTVKRCLRRGRLEVGESCAFAKGDRPVPRLAVSAAAARPVPPPRGDLAG